MMSSIILKLFSIKGQEMIEISALTNLKELGPDCLKNMDPPVSVHSYIWTHL